MFSALFSSPGMTTMTVAFIVAELASLCVAAAIIVEYERISGKTAALVRSFGEPAPRTYVASITYACATLAIGITTAYLYVVQPHLL